MTLEEFRNRRYLVTHLLSPRQKPYANLAARYGDLAYIWQNFEDGRIHARSAASFAFEAFPELRA